MIEKRLEPNWGWRAEVGLLSPVPWDCREYSILAPDGVKFSKCALGLVDANPESLRKMNEAIEVEAQKLNIGFKKDLICFTCTSASFIGGPGSDLKIIERIEKASGSPATTSTSCILQLFKDMDIRKLALAGPDPDPVLNQEVELFKAFGIDTLAIRGLGLAEMSELWDYYKNPYLSYRIAREAAKAAPDADCVFVTCQLSNLIGLADTLEEEIGKPVITSLSATMYGILKKLGIPDPVPNYGEALTRPRLP